MCIESFEISVATLVVGIVLELLCRSALCIKDGIAERKLESVVDSFVVVNVSLAQLVVGVVDQVPCVVGDLLDVCSPFLYGMLVKAVETGGIYEIYHSLGCPIY